MYVRISSYDACMYHIAGYFGGGNFLQISWIELYNTRKYFALKDIEVRLNHLSNFLPLKGHTYHHAYTKISPWKITHHTVRCMYIL